MTDLYYSCATYLWCCKSDQCLQNTMRVCQLTSTYQIRYTKIMPHKDVGKQVFCFRKSASECQDANRHLSPFSNKQLTAVWENVSKVCFDYIYAPEPDTPKDLTPMAQCAFNGSVHYVFCRTYQLTQLAAVLIEPRTQWSIDRTEYDFQRIFCPQNCRQSIHQN